MENPSPQPGDGICPTVSQHHATVATGYSLWAKQVSEAKDSTDSIHIADDFLELLQKIPEIYAPHSKAFCPHEVFHPRLKYALEWVITTNSTCERPIRRTYHYLMLGNPRPLECEFANSSEDTPQFPGLQAYQAKHLPRLILAWAYILSARWVEILNAAGETAFMNQRRDMNGESLWETIVERQWQATVTRGDKVFYAPWCLEQIGVNPKYVLRCASTIVTSLQKNIV